MPRILLLLLFFFILSCQGSIDIEAEKEKIQSRIDLINQAHFNKSATQFYQPYSEDWYDLRNGIISKVEKSERIGPTQGYLDKMEFQEIVERNDPIIEISNDGTLASYMAAVTVKGILDETPVYWVVSWQNTLRKIGQNWEIIAAVNTEADKETSAEVLLNRIREELGLSNSPDSLSIYANAECKGPKRTFQTLILSNESEGRMEQVYDKSHIILKHGKDNSWTFDVPAEKLNNTLDEETRMFVHGHELHWLSIWPECRFSNARLMEVSNFKNQNAFNIEFENDLRRKANFFYSFDSYLPLGFELEIDDKKSIVSVQFDDWEKNNGISVFKKAIFTQGDEIFEYDFTEVKLNDVDITAFESRIALIE